MSLEVRGEVRTGDENLGAVGTHICNERQWDWMRSQEWVKQRRDDI